MLKMHVRSSRPVGTTGLDNWTTKVRDLACGQAVTVDPQTPFDELVARLLQGDVDALVVVDEKGRPLGIIGEADLLSDPALASAQRARHGAGQPTGRRCAADLMNPAVVAVRSQDSVGEAHRRMAACGHNQLPVLDAEGRVVGMLRQHDLLNLFTVTDAQIAAEISALLSDPLQAPAEHEVSFSVLDGVVTLTGTTARPSDIAVIAAAVGGVRGVRKLQTRLRAREREPELRTAGYPTVWA